MQPYRANVMHLNTNCNVAHLAEHLFANFPKLSISKKCQHCNHENLRKVPIVTININIILQNGLYDLQNATIDTNYDKNSICKECHQTVLEKYNFQSHLLIDCSVFTDKRYAASIGIEKTNTTLGSVPKILNINKQCYILAGAVSYHQYASNKNNGHYTAYIHDTTRWYMYDDMMTKQKIASDDEEVAPHLIIYTIKK